MKLHALDLHASVSEAHDEAVGRRGRDFEAVGQSVALDDERVVAARREAIFESLEDGLAVVTDFRGLAVDGRGAAHDSTAEDLSDGLMAEAHAEDGHVPGQRAYQLQRHARLVRRPRPRRDDDAVGSDFIFHFLNRHLVVAPHQDLRAQLAEILHEVVRERIVVVYQQNFLAHRARLNLNSESILRLATETQRHRDKIQIQILNLKFLFLKSSVALWLIPCLKTIS